MTTTAILSPVPSSPRFVVGIDLGTTNCAVAFADTQATDSSGSKTLPRVGIFPVPQPVAPGEMERRPTLPSFLYQPTPGEGLVPRGDAGPPFPVVGVLARERGVERPGRVVASAKSWLSHAGVDRSADLLPWRGDPDVRKIAPAEAAARLLGHIRAAWNAAHPDAPLAAQDVVVTVPASFDAVARELTVGAARRAGLGRITLLEEPTAAFYAATAAATPSVSDHPRLILVCDVGGGTTDFTLVEVSPDGKDQEPRRVKVGEHLLLGGDNLDLALAHFVEARLGPPALEARQWAVLVRRCQAAKEPLLGPNAPERLSVSVPAAAGARLVGGGAHTAELGRAEVETLLVDGFLPRVGSEERPARRTNSGFQEFGLPYAADPAVTRHLATFLDGATPDAVLFNGGFFHSPALRTRLLEVLASWRGDGSAPVVVTNAPLDLAVALGAVRGGLARRGFGPRVGGGLARSYFLGLEGEGEEQTTAVCLAPAGLEENVEVTLPGSFDLRLRRPVEFPLFMAAAYRRMVAGGDQPGDLARVDDAETFTPLPPLRTVLRGRASEEKGTAAATARVRVHARLTEVGTLEVWCAEEDGNRRWNLSFDVRAAVPMEAGEDEAAETGAPAPEIALNEINQAKSALHAAFAPAAKPADAEGLVRRLEEITGQPRLGWSPAFLRELGDELLPLEPSARARAPAFETRWLNLLGFCLRPGHGFAGDDWRVGNVWRALGEKRPAHLRHEPARAEWAVLWRRVAGGLTGGQQRTLAAPLLAELRRDGGGMGWGRHEAAERWRLLGALEWLEPAVRTDLGGRTLRFLEDGRGQTIIPVRAALWTLGRLGAREPLHGPLDRVLPAETAAEWLERLLARPPDDGQARAETTFAVGELARRTGDRYRDVPEPLRARAVVLLASLGADPTALNTPEARRNRAQREAAFGESLPRGLRLAR